MGDRNGPEHAIFKLDEIVEMFLRDITLKYGVKGYLISAGLCVH